MITVANSRKNYQVGKMSKNVHKGVQNTKMTITKTDKTLSLDSIIPIAMVEELIRNGIVV